MMRKILTPLAFIACAETKAQQVTGCWFSEDSSRVYEIKKTGQNTFQGVIQSSSRKTDSTGFVVIKELQYNTRKKRYEGIIYAVSDNQPCFVRINTKNNQLVLKLSRMFLFSAVLKWNRAAAINNTVSQ